MLDLRLKSLRLFGKKPMPTWGSDLTGIDFQNIKYFVKSTEKQATTWDDLPEDIKNTYDRLGIPEAEKQRLVSGVAAQYESEVVYHQIREDLEEKGVIFVDTDTGLREHEDLFREYFASVIPAGDNKFAALNTAVWSGGSFIYVPPGVHVDIPLQAYFRINTENMGQFERTLIIADEGSYVHYVEGCTAPIYKSRLAALRGRRDHREEERPRALHDDPELVQQRLQPRHQAGDRGRGRDDGVDRRQHRLQGHDEVPGRLPPRRARQGRDAVDRLRGRGPAPGRRRQDGARGAQHLVDDRLASRSPAAAAARPTAVSCRSWRAPTARSRPCVCDALLVDTISRSDTYPYVDIREDDVTMGHEATVSKVSEDQLFYLMSRGHDRGGGHGDDRARLRRADRARAAHGVRPRAQPPDRAADGRSRRLMSLLAQKTARRDPCRGAHTDSAAAFVPDQSRAERTTSYAVADFPVPGGREEEWRFTPVDRLARAASPRGAPTERRDEVTARRQSTGRRRPRSQDGPAAAGVPVPADRAAVVAGAGEAAGDSVVSIPAEAELTEPVRIAVTGDRPGARATATSSSTPGSYSQGHRRARRTRGIGRVRRANVEVVVGDGADLTVVTVQEWDDDALHLAQHDALVGRDARLRAHRRDPRRRDRPGQHQRPLRRSRRLVEGARRLLRRRRPAPGAPLFVDHEAPHCRSNVDVQGRAAGRDRPHRLGRRRADPRRAPRAPTPTSSTATSSSPTAARADSVPNLEIETGEIVGAGHASATGRFDDEQLFYLQARGIPEDEARRLVVRGFFAGIVGRIGVPEVSRAPDGGHRRRARRSARRRRRGRRVSAPPSWSPTTATSSGSAARRAPEPWAPPPAEIDGTHRRDRPHRGRRRPRRRRHLHPRQRLPLRGRARRLHPRVLAARLAVRHPHRRAVRPPGDRPRRRLPRARSRATTSSSPPPEHLSSRAEH